MCPLNHSVHFDSFCRSLAVFYMVIVHEVVLCDALLCVCFVKGNWQWNKPRGFVWDLFITSKASLSNSSRRCATRVAADDTRKARPLLSASLCTAFPWPLAVRASCSAIRSEPCTHGLFVVCGKRVQWQFKRIKQMLQHIRKPGFTFCIPIKSSTLHRGNSWCVTLAVACRHNFLDLRYNSL